MLVDRSAVASRVETRKKYEEVILLMIPRSFLAVYKKAHALFIHNTHAITINKNEKGRGGREYQPYDRQGALVLEARTECPSPRSTPSQSGMVFSTEMALPLCISIENCCAKNAPALLSPDARFNASPIQEIKLAVNGPGQPNVWNAKERGDTLMTRPNTS